MRGQTTSLEFFVVGGVVSMIVIFSFITFDLSSSRTNEARQKTEMELIAVDIVDGLVKTSGAPGDWEYSPSTATSFGLAKSPLSLDAVKIHQFSLLDYNGSKSVLGIQNYQYFFRVKFLNDTVIKQSGVRPSNPKTVVNPTMAATLNNTVVHLDFMLWR